MLVGSNTRSEIADGSLDRVAYNFLAVMLVLVRTLEMESQSLLVVLIVARTLGKT